MTLTIHHNNGNQTRYADTMDDARRMLRNDYGDDIVTGDWESHNPDTERMLVWANDTDADGPSGCGDDGSHAVAEIIRKTK